MFKLQTHLNARNINSLKNLVCVSYLFISEFSFPMDFELSKRVIWCQSLASKWMLADNLYIFQTKQEF
jgi:hypothetical protein